MEPTSLMNLINMWDIWEIIILEVYSPISEGLCLELIRIWENIINWWGTWIDAKIKFLLMFKRIWNSWLFRNKLESKVNSLWLCCGTPQMLIWIFPLLNPIECMWTKIILKALLVFWRNSTRRKVKNFIMCLMRT